MAKRALFTSKNLIGDGIYIQPALAVWHKENPDWEMDLLTLDDHMTCIYRGMGLPWRIIFEKVYEHYDLEFTFDCGKAFKIGEKDNVHITEAYARMLGVKITSGRPLYVPPEGDSVRGLILLSMFSRSCASRSGGYPNKMIPWAYWGQILALVRQYGEIGLLGAKDDRAPLAVSEDEYYTGQSLEKVARLLRDAKVLITIDNGMAHLAASQETPTIEYYPACLGRAWITPANKNALVLQMDPLKMTAEEAIQAIRIGFRKFWREP